MIRTLIPSRIIAQYQAYCTDIGFEPASERTLFRILEVCSASMQKSLHGLDYINTEGVQGFECLENMENMENLTANKQLFFPIVCIAEKQGGSSSYRRGRGKYQ